MYRWVDHTGEVELEIEASDEAAVFRDAVAALGELLAELLFRAETEGFVPGTVTSVDLGDGVLKARVAGCRAEPTWLVKAVTYHRLRFERSGEGFRAGAVLDV